VRILEEEEEEEEEEPGMKLWFLLLVFEPEAFDIYLIDSMMAYFR